MTALASAALVVASLVTLTGPAGAAAAASPVGRLEYVGVQADHRGGPMSDILIVRGWEFDPDASINWADVRLYVDGRLQSDTRTPEDRADVSSAHGLSPGPSPGFYFRRFVDRGTHSYCVHALDVNAAGQHTGAFVDLGCRTVTSAGQWYVRGVAAPRAKFGVVGSKPLLCTDTSAGPVTPTLVVARDGYFAYTVNPATGYSINRFGRQGDLPVCGDWNGSGDQTLGVYRSSSATFYLTESFFPAALQAAHTIRLGRAGDLPVAGDWMATARPTSASGGPATARSTSLLVWAMWVGPFPSAGQAMCHSPATGTATARPTSASTERACSISPRPATSARSRRSGTGGRETSRFPVVGPAVPPMWWDWSATWRRRLRCTAVCFDRPPMKAACSALQN